MRVFYHRSSMQLNEPKVKSCKMTNQTNSCQFLTKARFRVKVDLYTRYHQIKDKKSFLLSNLGCVSNEVLCAVIIFKVSSHFVQVIIGRHFNLVSVPDPLRLSGQRRERSGLKPINYSLLAFSLRNFAKLRKEALFLSFLWSVISVAFGVFSHQNSRENDCTHTAWVLL